MATSTQVRFSCRSSFYHPQLVPALPGTHYSWVSWSNVRKVSCSRKHNYWSCPTFPNYTGESTGAMWIKFLLKETTTTNSTIQESNQDLLDHRLIPNHCCCLPQQQQWIGIRLAFIRTIIGFVVMCKIHCTLGSCQFFFNVSA